MLYVTVVLTMTIPNLIALQQKDIKECLHIHQFQMQVWQWLQLLLVHIKQQTVYFILDFICYN